MSKVEKGEIRITKDFEDTWKKFLERIKQKGIPSISAGLRWAVQEALREKEESIKLSKSHGKFLLQLLFASPADVTKTWEEKDSLDEALKEDSLKVKMENHDKCIICGKQSYVVVESPYGRYGLCENAWNSIVDLDEKDV